MKGFEFGPKPSNTLLSVAFTVATLLFLLLCALLEFQIIPGASLTWSSWSIALALFTGSAARLWCVWTRRPFSLLQAIIPVAVVVLFTVIWWAAGREFAEKEVVYFSMLLVAVLAIAVTRFNQQQEQKKEPPADSPS